MVGVGYTDHVKKMAAIAGIKSTISQRNDMEMRYFLHHKAGGVRLRGKYRPS
jgi:hypothetical protein